MSSRGVKRRGDLIVKYRLLRTMRYLMHFPDAITKCCFYSKDSYPQVVEQPLHGIVGRLTDLNYANIYLHYM